MKTTQNILTVFIFLLGVGLTTLYSQEQLTPNRVYPLANSRSLIGGTSTIFMTDDYTISNGTSEYHSNEKIITFFSLENSSVGIIAETSGDSYMFYHLNEALQLATSIPFHLPDDFGFPLIYVLKDGSYLFLNAIEQSITNYSRSGSKIFNTTIFKKKDYDHEKNMLLVQGENLIYIIGQETATGNSDAIHIFNLYNEHSLIDEGVLPLSVSYQAAIVNNALLAITGTSFTNQYQIAKHKLLLFDTHQNQVTHSFELETIPKKLYVSGGNVYLVTNTGLIVVNNQGRIISSAYFPTEIVPKSVVVHNGKMCIIGGVSPGYQNGTLSYENGVLITFDNDRINEFTLAHTEPFQESGFSSDHSQFFLVSDKSVSYYDLP